MLLKICDINKKNSYYRYYNSMNDKRSFPFKVLQVSILLEVPEKENISRLPAVKSNQNNSINLQSHKKKRSFSTVKTMPPKEPFKIKLN